MKNMRMMTATAGMLACAIIMLPCTNVFAASKADYTKNENVYAALASDGKTEGTYVVNTFTVTDAGEITDVGDYDKVQNLTNTEKIESDKAEHTMQADKGKFYYQGNLNRAELPWNIEVSYWLDGDEVDAEELAGEEGGLEIHVDIKKNQASENVEFFNTYMLQISTTLDAKLCEDYVAEGANVADAGSKERITYTVMPGTEDMNYVIRTNVENFEMDDISIAGVSTSPDFHESFVDEANNEHMGNTVFAMSVKGVQIPEEKAQEDTDKDNRNVMQKFEDKIKSLF